MACRSPSTNNNDYRKHFDRSLTSTSLHCPAGQTHAHHLSRFCLSSISCAYDRKRGGPDLPRPGDSVLPGRVPPAPPIFPVRNGTFVVGVVVLLTDTNSLVSSRTRKMGVAAPASRAFRILV